MPDSTSELLLHGNKPHMITGHILGSILLNTSLHGHWLLKRVAKLLAPYLSVPFCFPIHFQNKENHSKYSNITAHLASALVNRNSDLASSCSISVSCTALLYRLCGCNLARLAALAEGFELAGRHSESRLTLSGEGHDRYVSRAKVLLTAL